jgi:MFS family permease
MKIKPNKWTALFLSNFFGVFNDNFLKHAIIFVGIGWSMPQWLNTSQLISMVSAALVLPYLIFSPLGGRLAVQYSKLKVFRFFKLVEFPIVLIGSIAFYYQWVMLGVFAVLLMGIQSCLYSPSKYSLIRDIGGEEGVSYGSGVFETMAFLGILLGTVSASILADHYNVFVLSGLLFTLALLGYIFTTCIKAGEPVAIKELKSNLNPISFIINSYIEARRYKHVNMAIFGASAFWLIGGMLQMNLVIHSKNVYQLSNMNTGLIMATAAIGIALGSFSAGYISGKTVKKGLILIGLSSMACCLSLLAFVKLPVWLYVSTVFGLTFSGGFFQVPSLAMLQQSDIGRKLGDMIAYLNLLTFIFVLIGTALFSVGTWLTNENSFVIFALILIINSLTMIGFIAHDKIFFQETLSIFKRSKS